MINIANILKDAPKGMKLYSPLFGEVEFLYVDSDNNILVVTERHTNYSFTANGIFRVFKCHPHAECLLFPSKECRDWETWLLPTKPMFKVGDWVVDQTFAGSEGYIGEVGIIEGVTMLGDAKKENYYVIRGTDGKLLGGTDGLVSEYYLRPWNIKDAKEGDVLANDHNILIFKELNYGWWTNGIPTSVHAYCGIKPNGNFELGKENWCFCGTLHMHPATNEECDILFAKMREAGYTWDENKKELKKFPKHYDISSFHEGMPVLVRDSNDDEWNYLLFSHYRKKMPDHFFAGGNPWHECIPFEGNEHLLGTTNMPDECYINWRL